MQKKDVLEELSYSLSEKERVTLLERINRSLNINKDEAAEKDPEAREKEREILLEKELKQTGWFQKLIMLIRSRLSGKKISEIIVEKKMKDLKKAINRKQQGLTGFESRNLTPAFGEKVFDLYTHTFAFRAFYRKLWLEPGIYESCCLYIISAMFEETKNGIDDFISMDELVEIYAQSGKKDIIMEELESRLENYVSSIPSILYEEIENSIEPVYSLKDLILFPYTSFFQKFSFTPNRSDSDDRHFFKSASAMLCLDELENLFIAVMSASMLPENSTLNRFMIEYVRNLGEEDVLPENSQEELVRLINKVRKFNNSTPIIELLRYFRKDPFLQVKFIYERRSFRETYKNILRSLLKTQLDKMYPEIQRDYIEREISRLFRGAHFVEFRNYRKYASIDYQKMGLPFFTHTKSLNVLYNYIRSFYEGFFSDLIAILEKGILSQNRITRDRLLTHAVALQELEDKINASDKSLSPEEEDGKLFHKLRMTLASEPAQQRMFRSLVIHKNREVKSLIDWGEEALAGLEKIFEELMASSSTTVKIQLNKHYLIKGKSITLVSLLKTRAQHIREFRRLMTQIIKMELN